MRLSLIAAAVVVGTPAAFAAKPTPEQMLRYAPRQKGVTVAKPTAASIKGGKVELIRGAKNASGRTPSGWLLRDAGGRPVRCYLDTDGDNRIDVWCYYVGGRECYREIDGDRDRRVDQYRWLGPNGSRWGLDRDQDGKIDSWRVISPEEVSQEVLAAAASRDYGRLKALFITEEDLKGLGLPAADIKRVLDQRGPARQSFVKAAAALAKLKAEPRWVHFETPTPECVAADALGAKADFVRYASGSILYTAGEKSDFLQTGPLVQVGRAWKLVTAPAAGMPRPPAVVSDQPPMPTVDSRLMKLMDELRKVDEAMPTAKGAKSMAAYNMRRAAVLRKVAAGAEAEDRPQWVRQWADSLASAAQAGRDDAAEALGRLRDSLTEQAPKGDLTAYVTYRAMTVDYSRRVAGAASDPKKVGKVQSAWQAQLAGFVGAFPRSGQAPEAMMQLGMITEFAGEEAEAKKYYARLARDYPKSPQARRAAGAVRRLGLVGERFTLAAPLLGTGRKFDVGDLRGKPAVVYYWASWNAQTPKDFKALAALQKEYAGLTLVCVNVDRAAAEAEAFLKKHRLSAYHIHAPGGLNSPPAADYGVLVLPTVFVLDGRGRVADRNAQVATLGQPLRKLLR